MSKLLHLLLGAVIVLFGGCSSSDQTTEPQDPGQGAVSIVVEPRSVLPSWTLTGQDSVLATGVGAATILDIPVQTCTFAWEPVSGWALQGDNPVLFDVVKDDTVSVEAVYGVPFADTPEQAVENLRTSYAFMDIEFLRSVLAADYLSFLQQDTQDQFLHLGATLDVDQELMSAANIFSGQPITNSNGNLVPGVASIQFPVLNRVGDWAVAGPGERLPGAFASTYEVTIDVYRSGYSTLRSTGEIRFFAVSSDSLVAGEVRQHWKLVGQDDLTDISKRAIEYTAWGFLRALFL
jgi:hypothetical protein